MLSYNTRDGAASSKPVPRTYVRGFGALPFGMFGTFIPALTYGAFCGTR